MSFVKILFISCLALATLSCAKHEFQNVEGIAQSLPDVNTEAFQKSQKTAYTAKQVRFTQDRFEKNRTQVLFQVFDRLGRGVMGLDETAFEARENGLDFQNFSIDSSSQNLGKKVDIVFVLDVTNSMEQIIQSVKSKVRDFAESFSNQKIDGTLCLVTFRDATVKKCLVLTADDPRTPNNENIDQFFEDVSNARTKPAGDWNENQLRGLIDAAVSTPWRDMAQRMAVLITNSPFSYAPGNTGNAGSNAPTYQATVDTLRDQGVTVFTIGPQNTKGYDKKFNDQLDSLHLINGGKYFQYSKVLSGEISMEDIFNQIIDAVAANYTLDYAVEDQTGLKPELPLQARAVTVRAKNPDYRVRTLSLRSNQPNGRPELKKQFKLQRTARADQRNFQVRVQGQLVPADISETEVRFAQAPSAGSEIEVTYDPESLLETMRAEKISLPSSLQWESLVVKLNGQTVGVDRLGLSQNSAGEVIFDPNILLADIDDPYKVIEFKGLEIDIFGRVIVSGP
jgi:hypothetical protein